MLIKSKYFLRIACVLAIAINTASASVDTSGAKFSVYGGWQNENMPTSSFTLAGGQYESLIPSQNSSSDLTGGVGMWYRLVPQCRPGIFKFLHDIDAGIDYFYFNARQYGNTLDYGMFHNFDYRINVHSYRFMVNAAWTFFPFFNNIYPFIEGGVGPVFNSANYNDTPTSGSSSTVGLSMATQMKMQLAYDVGAGVKMMASDHVELSFQYLYSKLGSASIGSYSSLPINSSISIPITTQTWLFGVSYLT